MPTHTSTKPTTKLFSNAELVKWLNSHHPGKHFSGKTIRDHLSHGPVELIFVSGEQKMLRLPEGYKFDVPNQLIFPVNGENHWDTFVLINTANSSFIETCMDKVRKFFARFR